MSNSWPMVPLGEILTERQEVPPADGLAKGEIRILAKIAFDDGKIQLRTGTETRTGMILVRPGDLVVSGINAAKGAIAIYEDGNSEPIAATIHYGAYIPNRERAEVRYLWWLLRSGTFRDLLFEFVPGGIKTELKARRFLPIPIPLPPLPEQRRIVARLEELAAKIAEARSLRQRGAEEVDAFVVSVHMHLAGKRRKRLGEIVKLDEEQVPVALNGAYPQSGVKSFGAGLFPKPAISASETTYKAFNRLYEGALVLSQVKGWEGAVAVCPANLAGWFVSPEYRTFRCIEGEARPRYLAALVRTEWFWERLVHATRGVGARRERTRPEQFLNIEIPMPEFDQQRQGEKLFGQVDILKHLQAETVPELDAMLPSVLDRAFKGDLL